MQRVAPREAKMRVRRFCAGTVAMRNGMDVQALALVVQRVVDMTIARSLETRVRTDLRDAALPDLVAGVVSDMRELVEAQVGSLKSDLSDLLVNLGATIKSWLVALCVAIVTAVLIGLALAATLTQVLGVPSYAALWLVTGLAVGAVVALVYRARATGRKAAVDSQDVLAAGPVPARV
jgi:hypothetical protein